MAITLVQIRPLALALDDVEETTSYGMPAFKVKGVLFLRLHQDLDALVVRAEFEQRNELIAADPETYFITDHYLNYKWILVRLATIHPDAMRDLIGMAWKSARQAKARKPSLKKPRES
jgi:hypothetical protein